MVREMYAMVASVVLLLELYKNISCHHCLHLGAYVYNVQHLMKNSFKKSTGNMFIACSICHN